MSTAKGKLGIVGASGFIGSELAGQAAEARWEVVGFSRSRRDPGGGVAEWRKWGDQPDLSGLDALVNLAGESIDRRWTDANKRRFRESRVGVTETIVAALARLESRPAVLLNGSAVGIYGDRGEQVLDESAPSGDGYLAGLCDDWERAADPASELGLRVLKWRTGVVLGEGGAAWGKLKTIFSLGAGGRLGSGEQWMPWIHVEDLVGGMLWLLDSDHCGPVNATAPEPERNADFTRKLAEAIHRPAFMHAPAWALKLGLGGFADALLSSQRAVPKVLLDLGYPFRHATLEESLEDLLGTDDSH